MCCVAAVEDGRVGAWVGVQCNLSFCDMELPWRRSVGYLFVI
jgi:hypothetical protein